MPSPSYLTRLVTQSGSSQRRTSIARFKRSVVAHEVGHKWWGATVSHANDRHRWYRESLAEYFSALYLEFAYGYEDYLEQVDEWRRNLLASNLKANVQNAQTLFAGEWGGGNAKDITALQLGKQIHSCR